jgi:hypothetical protein
MRPKRGHLALALILLAATAWALAYTVDVSLVDAPGVRMVLPAQLGPWRGRELRYCHNEQCEKREYFLDELFGEPSRCPSCGGPLHSMSKEEYDALPKDTEFIKSHYQGEGGRQVFVSIVLTGRDRESIHRPERCLTGQGFAIESARVIEVPIEGRRPLRLRLINTVRPVMTAEGPGRLEGYYAYWFVGQRRETPFHLSRMFWLAWDRVVHSVAHRWAYISVAGRRDGEGAYLDEIRDVVARLHSEIVLR